MRHLTAINDLDQTALFSILEKSLFYFQNQSKIPDSKKKLKDKVIANIFFENSTRTRFSFEVAAKKLGAHVLNFSKESSSMAKGETLYDTLKTFEAFGVDIAVIRHSDDDFITGLKDKFRFQIVNAGAGKYEHPSQSLLDLFTIQQEFKKFEGLTVTICGDINSSRVAKSNITALGKMGANIILAGPQELLPETYPAHCKTASLDEALPVSDVMMFLRIQHERHQAFELPIENYNQYYGLNDKRMAMLKDTAIIMHPGPFNREVEIQGHLVEHNKSRIFKQVENGVYTRMGIFEWLVE